MIPMYEALEISSQERDDVSSLTSSRIWMKRRFISTMCPVDIVGSKSMRVLTTGSDKKDVLWCWESQIVVCFCVP